MPASLCCTGDVDADGDDEDDAASAFTREGWREKACGTIRDRLVWSGPN